MKVNGEGSHRTLDRLTLFKFAVSLPILLTIPVVAAGITAFLVSPLANRIPGNTVWGSVVLMGAVPLIYFVWLILFLVICALDVQSRRWYRGLRKVPRVSSSDGILKFFPILSLYLRARLVYSLPLVEAFTTVPGLRWLVVMSYSTSAKLGKNSYMLGMLFDPDLTDVGTDAVIGAETAIVAHSLTTNPDGTFLLVTAPIVIGPRVVIGGNSRIGLGVSIGPDALVEPCSNVSAYTTIPPAEVWGGNPATFIRKRFESCSPPTILEHTPSPLSASFLERDVRNAVATALNLPFDVVSATFSCQDCLEWDSLGQMAVASVLHSLTGTAIPMDRCFQLKSVPDIVAYLASRKEFPTHNEPPSVRTGDSLPADPELLPLLNPAQATRLLASRDSATVPSPQFPITKVIVAATFSAEPLDSTLKLWSNAFGIPVAFETAGFDQVPQALLSSNGSFRLNVSGLNVVLARPEDLLIGSGDRSEPLLSAIGQFAREFPDLLVVANLPPVVSRDCSADREQIRQLRTRWDHTISAIAGIHVVDFAGIIERLGTAGAANAVGDRIAGVPYSAEVYAELAIALARQVRCRRRTPAKVLALDADGVLWGNVLAEDGFDGISLGSEGTGHHFQLFQKSVLKLKDRGVLLAVVSRNELADVRRVFETHPGMILRADDIAAWRVNWQPKSQNLKEIASELNLGLDAFVFVDDDAANQLEVNSHLPEVTVLPLPPAPADYSRVLEQLWCFDAAYTTEADTRRTQMTREEQERQKIREDSIDLDSYLASLGLRVAMRAARAADMPRVAQLTQKTNQFNLSLKRRSEAELCSLPSGYSIHVVEVSDRLGDYGLVGVCILIQPSTQSECVEIDTFLISCRALGRGVEDAILCGMLELARSYGCCRLEAELVAGPRNQPVSDFLRRSGFVQSRPDRFGIATDISDSLPRHIEWVGPLGAKP